MTDFSQGDVIKIDGFRSHFLIVSNNAFIQAAKVFHICPIIEAGRGAAGPLHIAITGNNGEKGIAICEQIKMIDPSARACSRVDAVSYGAIMDVSDAVQGMFEYD